MFFELLFFVLAGVLLGTFTGIVPGIHPNTLFLLLLSLSPVLVQLPLECVLVFIVSVAVSNTFTDFIPSIFLGAPDPDAALSVLPAHRLLLAGRGYEALVLSVAGGIGAVVLTLSTLPLLFILLPTLYFLTRPYIHILLLIIVAWMVITEKNTPVAAAMFLLAGAFGTLSLNTLPENASLFPALTGMFGISTMLVSIHNKTTLPKQERTARITHPMFLRGSATGWFAGLLSGLLPGIGAAQAGTLTSEISGSRKREFLVALGGINTSNMIFTILVFYLIGKIRSGATHAISQFMWNIGFSEMLLIISAMVLVCFTSAAVTLFIGKHAAVKMGKMNYTKTALLTLLFLIAVVFFLSGAIGILVCCTGVMIGTATVLSGIKRTHMMGFLILPTILYFSGMQNALLFAFGL